VPSSNVIIRYFQQGEKFRKLPTCYFTVFKYCLNGSYLFFQQVLYQINVASITPTAQGTFANLLSLTTGIKINVQTKLRKKRPALSES
jgi:hypothetical protein